MLRFENAAFFRIKGETAERIPSSHVKRVRHAVSLAPFRSVAITPFSFPFGSVIRIRDALKLQTLPYAAAGGMELFPYVTEKMPRSSGGVALFIPSGELESLPAASLRVEARVWPAPLPLASTVKGNGVTLWADEENICSMLWREGAPVFYRWKPRGGDRPSTSETELTWYEMYCKSRNEEVGEVFTLDAANPSELAKLPGIAGETLALYPWVGDVNLSRSALDSTIGLERAVRSLSIAASWILIMGLLVLLGNGLRYYQARQNVDVLRRRTVDLYRSVYEPSRGGAIADPVGLARSVNQQLKGGYSDGRQINEVFTDLGEIFEQNPSMDVTLDSVRYTADGADYTGSVPDMGTAQEFRRAWTDRAASAQLTNLNNAPGAGYRFDISVKW